MKWEVIKDGATDWGLEVKDPDGWFEATVKFDGCIHFYRYFNRPKNEQDLLPEEEKDSNYLHICSIDDMIQRLQELKSMAKQHFGEDWE